MIRFSRFLWMVIPWVLACGASGNYREWEASSPRVAESGGQLGPGDLIEVKVFRENDLSGVFQVGPDGTIDFPLIGTLAVAGQTAPEVASLIRQRLGEGYLQHPHVTVLVKEVQSRRIYVLGQVERPGTFKYEEGMTVVQAITLAGGFTKTARPDATVVTRVIDGRETRFVVPVEEISRGTARNLPLLPGDIVFVPQSIL
ncbi:MAG TPA: polysaccharide biosynthesis/export family protein [Myxococcota bacterium]|nr:polysaccharide biosynthesis/export family protein [Myxococcota bacterium]HQK51080.1 polysaccharide biosynthesis/export family protein [Myxococcota bacterium]